MLFVLALAPAARLFILGFHDGLGANPAEFVTQSTGIWALVMLCLTLAVTPLRRLTGWNTLLRVRRMLGLFAFFYTLAHFAIYFWVDQWFDLLATMKDLLDRPFIGTGFLALLLMLPLALSSNHWSMRRLGRRWQQLHRLIYPIALLAVLHFWLDKAGKNDFGEPAIYAAVVAILLLARVGWALGQRIRTSGQGIRASAQQGIRASAQVASAQPSKRRSSAKSSSLRSRSRTS